MKKLIAIFLVLFSITTFAQKITDMPTATGTGAGGIVYIVQGGISKNITTDSLSAAAKRYADSLKAVLVIASNINAANIANNTTAIGTKLNISDTPGIRLRPIAGTNTTITGNYPNLTFNSTASVYTASNGIVKTAANVFKLDSIYTTGSATKFMWDSIKQNFNAGGNLNSNSYTNSAAFSAGTSSNTYSTAMSGGTASGFSSTAMSGGIASGSRSTAMSQGTATGDNSTAMGGTALGISSTAIGDRATAIGNFSTAMSGGTSIVPYSNAMSQGISSGRYSTAIGYLVKSKSSFGTAVGSFNDSTYSPNTVNYDPINRAFEVGVGTADASRQNALTVLFNGSTGFGTVTPAATSVVDITSTTQGFLTPRMTTTQRNAITLPATGLQVFNLTDSTPNYFNGSTWQTTAVQKTIVVGDVYNKTSFTNLADFGNTGATASIVANKIRLSGGTNDYTKFVTLDSLINCDTDVSMEINYTLVAGVGQNGIGIGRKSTNTTFSNSVCGQFANFPNFGGAYLNQGNSTNITIFKDTLFDNLPIGTNLKIVFTQKDNVITLLIQNVTNGYQKTVIYEDALGTTGNLPTTSKWAIWAIGTQTVDISSIKINSQSQVGADYCLIGDSKMVGYGTNDVTKTIKNILGIQMYAAGGDKTAEVLSALPYLIKYLKPKAIIAGIGSNDIRASIVLATWQANYLSIVNLLAANNITGYHFLSIKENTLNQTALYDYIKSIIATNKQIDVYGFITTGMLASDGIHPNVTGNKMLVNILRAQGLFNK